MSRCAPPDCTCDCHVPPPPARSDIRPMPEGLKERTLAEIAARKRAKQDGTA